MLKVLYGNVGLSIHPHRKDQVSKDMLSWFPLFFPFKVVSDGVNHVPKCELLLPGTTIPPERFRTPGDNLASDKWTAGVV